jgi:prolipoprotein diacylglyceryltransferase
VPPAVIELDFDPILRIGDLSTRLETIALALVILLGLVIAAIAASRQAPEVDAAPPSALTEEGAGTGRLRLDDLLFIVLGILPGAVIGGRLGYALIHPDYYAANPAALFDPALGSGELGLAVVGGTLTGAAVARLLDGPPSSWLRVAAVPLLVILGLGKTVMAVGGRGQGAPAELPWATAFTGPGPWGSLAPATPSHPSQLYEAVLALVALAALLYLLRRGRPRLEGAAVFLAALALWASGRFLAAGTWRDADVLGPLGAGQLIALTIAVAAGAGAAVLTARRGERAAIPEPQPSDPATPIP